MSVGVGTLPEDVKFLNRANFFAEAGGGVGLETVEIATGFDNEVVEEDEDWELKTVEVVGDDEAGEFEGFVDAFFGTIAVSFVVLFPVFVVVAGFVAEDECTCWALFDKPFETGCTRKFTA